MCNTDIVCDRDRERKSALRRSTPANGLSGSVTAVSAVEHGRRVFTGCAPGVPRAAMHAARMHSRGVPHGSLAPPCGSVLAWSGLFHSPLRVHHHGAPQRQQLRPRKQMRQFQHKAARGLEPYCGTSGVPHAAEDPPEVRPPFRLLRCL